MEAILEGLLFVVGDEGLTAEQIEEIMNIDYDKLKKLINNLEKDYRNSNRGITLMFLGEKYKLTTKKEHHEYYEKLVMIEQTKELSQASLETLAIIAYNEPITRTKIDEIRGVATSQIVRKLLLRDLIKELGKSNLPGRPTLFGITSKFLDYFGLKTKEELPPIQFNSDVVSKKVNLFESKYQENDTN
ncbi:MAG: SMC-Scp complex subunit ScpB [Bacilli bacterium]